jgi:hypothetical protein
MARSDGDHNARRMPTTAALAGNATGLNRHPRKMLHPISRDRCPALGVRLMDWISLGRLVVGHLKSEWDVISGAPGTVVLLAFLLALCIWYFVNYHFAQALTSKDSALSNKDATIELLRERHLLSEERLREAVQNKDKVVQKLSALAAFEPAKVNDEIKHLRAELDERRAREWQLLSKEQEAQLIKLVQRNGSEDIAHKTISIACDEFPDSYYLGAQLVSVFKKAGWSLSREPTPEQVWADIAPGLNVQAPQGHLLAAFLMDALAQVFGRDLVCRQDIQSPLPKVLDAAMVVQIAVGRKPSPLSG